MNAQQRIAKFERSLAAHLEPEEHVVAGVMGRAGPNPHSPLLAAADQMAAGETGGRMVVLTDRRIIVARTSWWWGWRVKRVAKTFPSTTPVRVRDEWEGALIEVDGVRVHTVRAGKRWAADLAAHVGEASS